MKTAVDSSVLLDVFAADPGFGQSSRNALRAAYDRGALVACDVVWAEVRAHFSTDVAFQESVKSLGVRFDAILPETAVIAGRMWREGRMASKRSRERLIADFLIGAHGRLQADKLLSRDRGFYRLYFRGLEVIDPGAG